MGTDYRRYMLERGPAWIQGPAGGSWLQAQGDVKDALVQRAREGVKSRFPDATIAADDALAAIGSERQIPRAPGEAAEDYALRLQSAWDIWPWAGTPYGMLRALSESSFTGAIIGTQTQRHTLNADGTLNTEGVSWVLGYDPEFWNAFEVLFVPPHPASWGGVVPGPTSPEAEFIKAMVLRWKPAHAIPIRVIVYSSGELWGWPEGTWDDPGDWGESTTVTYWSF